MATLVPRTPQSSASADNNPFTEPPGKLPEMISNNLVRVDKRIGPCLTAQQHHALIQVTAYYLAEHRHFEPGHESEDWARAEILVINSSGLPVI